MATTNILVLNSGGTISMTKDEQGMLFNETTTIPAQLISKLRRIESLNEQSKDANQSDDLVLPEVQENGKKVVYKIENLKELYDSSNMSQDNWTAVAKAIENEYQKYDGFVVLHGTDTMAYTASALSFMFENLGKSVVITGAQVSIFDDTRESDGVLNLRSSIIVAAKSHIKEVMVCFNGKVFRGNRCTKVDADGMDAFASPKFTELGSVEGNEFEHSRTCPEKLIPNGEFSVFTKLSRNVRLVHTYPGIPQHVSQLTPFLKPTEQEEVRGIVLTSFGAGNIPDKPETFKKLTKEACDEGVFIVIVTQCNQGSVSTAYQTGAASEGRINGKDMTIEAAFCKLCFVLGKWGKSEQSKEILANNMRGEITDGSETRESNQRAKVLEDAKKVKINMDKNLPSAKQIKIRNAGDNIQVRVKVYGWVHDLNRQDKNNMSVTLRDGTGLLKCSLTNTLCQTYDALILATESAIVVYGLIEKDGNEVIINVDFWEMLGNSPPLGADNTLNEEAPEEVQLDKRHLMIRSEKVANIMKMRSAILQCFREYYFKKGYFEISPPTMVQTKVHDRSATFKMDYFGREVYLTQSSQQYLETALPAMGDVFCIGQSYRADTDLTNQHLTEFTLVEAECPFISFEELLTRIEDLVCDVVDCVLEKDLGALVQKMNINFQLPDRKFSRMEYTEAITWLESNNIRKDNDSPFKRGDVIPEDKEMKIVDGIGKPIFLLHLPQEVKPTFKALWPHDKSLTESVHLLMPGVGKILGGSMRVWKQSDVDNICNKSPDFADCSWYTDQSKYGPCPHGGYALGLERFVYWMLRPKYIRDVCLYPRLHNRCKP